MAEQKRGDETAVIAAEVGHQRERLDLSRRQLARAAHLRTRRLRALERGAAAPSDEELASLAAALGVPVSDLVPVGYRLSVVHGRGSLQGDEALDALLREYVLMVQELRGADTISPSTLRHDDLTELGRMLGGTAEMIETKLVELLDIDVADADLLRSVILPSAISV